MWTRERPHIILCFSTPPKLGSFFSEFNSFSFAFGFKSIRHLELKIITKIACRVGMAYHVPPSVPCVLKGLSHWGLPALVGHPCRYYSGDQELKG